MVISWVHKFRQTSSIFYIIFFRFIFSQMKKRIALLFVLALALMPSCLAFTLFESKGSQEGHSDASIQVGDYIENGSAITPEFKSLFKSAVEQAFVFNANSYIKNIMWIQNKLNAQDPGNWVVGIFGSLSNSSATKADIGQNLGISSYSTGGQYWMYWQGVNHYQPNAAYYVSKSEASANSSGMVCFGNGNYSSSTDVFRNVVNAAEVDTRDMQNFSSTVSGFLSNYSPGSEPTVVSMVTSNLTAQVCQWGQTQGNYLFGTPLKKYIAFSIPRI